MTLYERLATFVALLPGPEQGKAAALGVSRVTLSTWLRYAREGEPVATDRARRKRVRTVRAEDVVRAREMVRAHAVSALLAVVEDEGRQPPAP